MTDERRNLLRKLRRRKVMTIDEVAENLGCVPRSAHRKLKLWEAYRSCNMNGRYYTLPEISTFDNEGLWRYEDIVFSRHGNLKETVIYLLDHSKAGMTAECVAKLTGISTTSSFLYQLRSSVKLEWGKHYGKAVFFSRDQTVAKQQRRERQLIKMPKAPSCEDCVLILVELIRDPKVQISTLTARLRRIGRQIDSDSIRLFLEQHDLLKKTWDTSR